MAEYYADSSMLVKHHVQESGTPWVKSVFASNVITTAEISIVEVYSALNRRLREGSIQSQDYTQIITDFSALCSLTYRLVQLSTPIIERTRFLLEHYPLRAYDAVQLASALIINDIFLTEQLPALTFLSADHRLLAAAQQEGIPTDDPGLHV
jgi:hypothetical protein